VASRIFSPWAVALERVLDRAQSFALGLERIGRESQTSPFRRPKWRGLRRLCWKLQFPDAGSKSSVSRAPGPLQPTASGAFAGIFEPRVNSFRGLPNAHNPF